MTGVTVKSVFVRRVVKVTSFLALPHLIPPILYWLLRARGARQGPCGTDCPGCLLQPPGCWLYSPLPRTELGYGGGSWWPWQPSGPVTPTAGSPCSLVGRRGTEAWKCPPGSSCARRWFHLEGLPSGCRPPIRDRGMRTCKNWQCKWMYNKTSWWQQKILLNSFT